MIQNLSNLTKKLPLRSLTMQGAVSIEITDMGLPSTLRIRKKILQQTS
jgi:hypothetical protein